MPTRPTPTTWEAFARDLGLELQRQRLDRGITQEDLAHKAGLTRTHYQQIERGFWKKGSAANPSVKVLARLAQVLGVEVGQLVPAVATLTWPDA